MVRARKPMLFDVSMPDSDPKARIQQYIDTYREDEEYAGFEALVMRSIRVVSAEVQSAARDGMEAIAIFEIEALHGLCNAINIMHGGAVATVVDMATSMATAPVSKKNFWELGGVTRTLSVTLLTSIPEGATIVVECMLRAIGKRLSTTQCVIKDKISGKVVAIGEHGKAALSDQDPRL